MGYLLGGVTPPVFWRCLTCFHLVDTEGPGKEVSEEQEKQAQTREGPESQLNIEECLRLEEESGH